VEWYSGNATRCSIDSFVSRHTTTRLAWDLPKHLSVPLSLPYSSLRYSLHFLFNLPCCVYIVLLGPKLILIIVLVCITRFNREGTGNERKGSLYVEDDLREEKMKTWTLKAN
jgi:hypothetical protein